MRYRTFGRTAWQVSEIGYGMWGMGGWTGSDDAESLSALNFSVELGCNFFDTAWAYGDGHSEQLLGELIRAHPEKRLYTATKIPPLNRKWPSRPGDTLAETYPAGHIHEYTFSSLEHLGLDQVDLIQFHTWNDEWGRDPQWQRAVEDLKRQELVGAVGISVNRWEPDNVLETLRTGLVDAVQVIYNIFDQNPEDQLFPLCRELGVAVIARVPFDEGTLTGTLTPESRWPEGDWRNTYFVPENLKASVERAEQLKAILPAGMSLPEMALRFILANPEVATIIPGMRREKNVRANIAASDAGPLDPALVEQLRPHRWLRTPTPWSQ